jgi:hypothetical protein
MNATPDAPGARPPPDAEGAAAALAGRYAKTETGRAEVRGRTQTLTRQARNLLLIIEPARPAAEWASMVQGCGLAELQALLAAGLIAPAAAVGIAPTAPAVPAPSPAATPPAGPAAPSAPLAQPLPPTRVPLSQALARLGYRTLYDRITALARPRLGLFKGYRLILEVERCSGPDEVRALALRFVEQVREVDGEAAAQALAEQLAAPDVAPQ